MTRDRPVHAGPDRAAARGSARCGTLGVALVNVSMGNPYASPHVIRPFEYPPPDGYETPEHPLVGVDRHFRHGRRCSGRTRTCRSSAAATATCRSSCRTPGRRTSATAGSRFVGVGRATLAQPDFVRQLLDHGKLDRKRVCRTFSYCTALMRSKHNELGQFATGCPPFDKEVYGEVWKEVQALQVKKSPAAGE